MYFLAIMISLSLHLSSAQEVKERLLCHAIIGRNPHKERIMTVDIVCLFIAPLLEFSTKEVTFRMEQVYIVNVVHVYVHVHVHRVESAKKSGEYIYCTVIFDFTGA